MRKFRNPLSEGFTFAAATLAMGELFAWLTWQNGMDVWTSSPHPERGLLVYMLFGVLMPISGLLVLWFYEPNPERLTLLVIAAATIIHGALMAVGATIGLAHGDPVAHMLPWYLPLIVSLTCLALCARERPVQALHATI